MAEYVDLKANFSTVFAAQTQGLSMGEALAKAIGKNSMSNNRKVRKPDAGDVVKVKLAFHLREQLGKLDPISIPPSHIAY